MMVETAHDLERLRTELETARRWAVRLEGELAAEHDRWSAELTRGVEALRARDEYLQKLATATERAAGFRAQRDEAVAALAALVQACDVLAGLDPDSAVFQRALGEAAIAERTTVARQVVERYRRATITPAV